jgi:hypothetical protein
VFFFQSGELSLQDFHFIVAHPDILPELVSVRGLMKRKFPTQKSGTLKQGNGGGGKLQCQLGVVTVRK